MKRKNLSRFENKQHRHQRILKRIRSGNEHLRLRITKTNAHIYAQLVDDLNHKTILSSSSLQLDLANGNVANATKVGLDLVQKMHAHQIKQITFDRGGSKYHGRIAAIATVLREHGIKV